MADSGILWLPHPWRAGLARGGLPATLFGDVWAWTVPLYLAFHEPPRRRQKLRVFIRVVASD